MDEREPVQLKVRKSTHDYFRDMAAETGLPKSSLMGACLDAAARNGWRFAIVRVDGGGWKEGGQEGACGGGRGSGAAGQSGAASGCARSVLAAHWTRRPGWRKKRPRRMLSRARYPAERVGTWATTVFALMEG